MHDFWGYILQLLQRGIVFAVPAMLFFVVALAVVWLIARKKNRSMPWKSLISPLRFHHLPRGVIGCY